MNNILKVKEFCNNALSISDGEIIKTECEKILEKIGDAEEKIIIDFEGITLFSTSFFNASIGYFIVEYSPKLYDKKIECINLSDLGKETLRYSYENAVEVYNKKPSIEEKEKITDIVEKNINNS